MRTITLEILRHGVAHNQLLSPLTEYLVLCGNHGAEMLRVPFEHNQLLHRLRALGYKSDEETRHFQLTDTARVLGGLLEWLRGLNADFSRYRETPDAVLHLRLVISASELALIPFELSTAPAGFPGAGDWLLLQNQLPVCLTREVRRDCDLRIDWRKTPKILFIAAQPPGVGTVPLRAHLLALRREVEPWINAYGDADARREQIEAMLTVLPEATADQIGEACARNDFTHIHILAHGVRYAEGDDHRFGIALHPRSAGAPADLVDGNRLAKLLRAVRKPDSRGFGSPCVVTLACCDAANVGSVAGAGSSVAHALHTDGIPMVVASQFPLTFEGSILMVETLSRGLLRGLDPRRCLNDLRRQLRARLANSHDWASLVAYAALPADYDEQLLEIQVGRAKDAIESVLADADRTLCKKVEASDAASKKNGPDGNTELDRNRYFRRKIGEAKEMLECILKAGPDAEQKARIFALLASMEKRTAQFYSRLGREKAEDSVAALKRALDYYRQFAEQKPAESWPIHQMLSLSLALGRKRDHHGEMWLQSLGLAQAMLARGSGEQALWARTNLIEIFLLACDTRQWTDREIVEACLRKIAPAHSPSAAGQARAHVRLHVQKLIGEKSLDPFTAAATARQIQRYGDWLTQIKGSRLGEIGPVANEMLKLLDP